MVFLSSLLLLQFVFIVNTSMYENEININDILRTDLMPTYFIDNSEDLKANVSDESAVNSGSLMPSINGSIDAALSTLSFHRKMMNEYQCRNFVAEQILEEMGKPVLQNRVGVPFSVEGQTSISRKPQDRGNFLYDVGSANYQDWLAKLVDTRKFPNKVLIRYCRPRQHWYDDIKKVAGPTWPRLVAHKHLWHSMKKDFTQKWVPDFLYQN